MSLLVAIASAQEPAGWPAGAGLDLVRGFVGLVVVFGLLAAFVWAVRRGSLLRPTRLRGSDVRVETAVPLGERRSLVVVAVDGRRLLLGLTPMQVTLVAELRAAAPAFGEMLDQSVRPGASS